MTKFSVVSRCCEMTETVVLTWQLLPDVTDCHIVDWVIFKWHTLGAVCSVWRGWVMIHSPFLRHPVENVMEYSVARKTQKGTNDAEAHLKVSVLSVSLVFYCYRCLYVRRRCSHRVFHFRQSLFYTSLHDAFSAIWVRFFTNGNAVKV